MIILTPKTDLPYLFCRHTGRDAFATTSKKWGNSLALRIPKSFAQDAAVKEGTLVDVSVSEGKLVVTSVRKKRTTLTQLLTKVHRGNLHGEIDSGPPLGREAW
jgi:antitoxin MazE